MGGQDSPLAFVEPGHAQTPLMTRMPACLSAFRRAPELSRRSGCRASSPSEPIERQGATLAGRCPGPAEPRPQAPPSTARRRIPTVEERCHQPLLSGKLAKVRHRLLDTARLLRRHSAEIAYSAAARRFGIRHRAKRRRFCAQTELLTPPTFVRALVAVRSVLRLVCPTRGAASRPFSS